MFLFSLSCAQKKCIVLILLVNFSLQKLKLSVMPHALEEMKKRPYCEKDGGLGQPQISVISFDNISEKDPAESKF